MTLDGWVTDMTKGYLYQAGDRVEFIGPEWRSNGNPNDMWYPVGTRGTVVDSHPGESYIYVEWDEPSPKFASQKLYIDEDCVKRFNEAPTEDEMAELIASLKASVRPR